MAAENGFQPSNDISFCSSLKDDLWHNLSGPNAFESWHFDAVSDDGREIIVIAFYDNYVLSPRFVANSHAAENVTVAGRYRFPAVSFVYARDGQPILASINEFVEGDFISNDGNGCSVGTNTFRIVTAEYGTGFVVKIDLAGPTGNRIRAEMEWLLVESDLMAGERTAAVWNAVAPRADVSGKIYSISRRGKVRKTIQFRGTGYHDQVSSANVHYRDLSSRMWGRAHFVDSTVVFDRLGGVQNYNASGHFYLIRDGRIEEHEADCQASEHKRDFWGLSVPRRICFTSLEGSTLTVKPMTAFRSGLSEVKMQSEITLSLLDGKLRKTVGITEFVDLRRLRHAVFRWISDMRIGRKDRSPLF